MGDIADDLHDYCWAHYGELEDESEEQKNFIKEDYEFMFKPAEKKKLKAKVCLDGGSGSGKTYSALLLAEELAEGGKIALIDTENRSASLYADRFKFDVLDLYAPYTPEKYVQAIKGAENAGYSVLIIDSITHEWSGEGGCLDIQSALGGRYQDWAKVTPRHNDFIGAILNSKIHVIATVRTKMGYEMGMGGNGKVGVQKVGTQPITRDGFEYEMTVVFSLNQNHYANCSKDRTSMFDGKDFIITREVGNQLLNWLNSGSDNPHPPKSEEVKTADQETKPERETPVATEPKREEYQPKKSYINAEMRSNLENGLSHAEYGPLTSQFMAQVGATIDDCTVDQYNQIAKLSKDYVTKNSSQKQATVTAEPVDSFNPEPERSEAKAPKKAVAGQIAAINKALELEYKDIMNAELDGIKVFRPEDLTFEQAKMVMIRYTTAVSKRQAVKAA